MPRETILSTPNGSLFYYPEDKIVHHVINSPIGGEEFRHLLNTGVGLLRANGASKWLSDDRSNSVLSPEDSDWGMQVWVKNAIDAGWKYWGLVVPEGMSGRASMKGVIDDFYERGVRIQLSSNPEELLAWLKRM
jgi:hypothetical protein